MSKQTSISEQVTVIVPEGLCQISAAPPAARACPNCGRIGTLVPAGDALFCAACGFASDGARGCT